MRVSCRALLILVGSLCLSATSAAADCQRAVPPNGQFPAKFCIDGDLPQGGHDSFIWTLNKKQSRHPWTWRLRGADGAVTRFEIHPIKQQSIIRKPVYTLLDRAPLTEENPRVVRAGETGTTMLRPGRYSLHVSCDGECTGKGDPYRLRVSAAPTTEMLGYQRERKAGGHSGQMQQVGDVFTLDGDLAGSTDTYVWPMNRGDAATCWQIFLMLPPGERGWVGLYGPDGRLRARRQTDANGNASFFDLGLGTGRYLIRVGPGKHGYTPYRLFSTPLGSRVMGRGPAGFTLACPVLQGE